MSTELQIDGTRFLINGRPTYEGRDYQGNTIEGLLLNSRMVQAIFDDACEETVQHWAYPDTGEWDPERNTAEFCAALPTYRQHGLLGVTVGLQGGGSIYTPEIYRRYRNSAFAPDGTLKPAYMARLKRILETADGLGMVVIVNLFYVQQMRHMPDPDLYPVMAEAAAQWLLDSGHRNILVDVANEANAFWKIPEFAPDRVHTLIEAVQSVTLDGRRLPAAASSGGGDHIASGRWLEVEDVSMPHGNGCTPDRLKAKIRTLRDSEAYRNRPRPVLINEDSIFVDNMTAAIEEYASWGFYCQGYGSQYQDRMNWKEHPRENEVSKLSGFQTVPVNWTMNTPVKRAFFDAVRQVTGGA